MPETTTQDNPTFADIWDQYISDWRNGKAEGKNFPGDQWGKPDDWDFNFDALIRNQVPAHATRFVEIGPGAGKYTERILAAYPDAQVLCADVSNEYLRVLVDRLSTHRVIPILLDGDPKTLFRAIRTWCREEPLIDCICSFDAMVHVDLQYLIVYWLTAMETLRIGGKLCMTLGDATSDKGFHHIINAIPDVFPYQGRASAQFHWMSPDLVHSVLDRLGFTVEFAPTRADMHLVAMRCRRNVEPIKWGERKQP